MRGDLYFTACVCFRYGVAASCAGRTHPSNPYVPTHLLSRSRSRPPSAPELTSAFRHSVADIVIGTGPELSRRPWTAREYELGLVRVHSIRGQDLRRHPANVVFDQLPQGECAAFEGGRTTIASKSPRYQEHHAGIRILEADQRSSNVGCG